MRKNKTRKDHIEDAARAHTDLNVFHGVMAQMEGGLLGSDCYGAAERIVNICKAESAKCLDRYDRAVAAASK